MTNDSNLLFAVLALQMEFVSEEDLLAAMNAWGRDKSSHLGDILVDRQGLTPKRRDLLEAMAQEQLEEHDGDVEKSLAWRGSAGPLREMISRIVDGELQGTSTVALGAGPDVETNFTSPDPKSGTRFVILRPHAKGGLGEVFVAQDQELNRVVALKEIQARYNDDESSRARFIQEAEITGCLEHPGIVPIYGFGRYEDGRPFYAMRFIEGDSLKQAIDRFHESTHPGAGDRVLGLRKLLGAFIAVCQAVHYAHIRGVVHRDLKPDNVMLGRFGETLVVDWGLAKHLQPALGEAAGSEAAPRAQPLTPSASGLPRTSAGTALGTPAFMSPEQAAGRLAELGPATDVYSLGATLYYLLTGQAAFAESDFAKVRQRVLTGDFPRPRSVQIQVPPALEGICLKAMALRPEDRYGSAQALADDVEQWLADEPVRAYRDPWWSRLARWARRHRPLVAGAAVLLVAAVVGLTWGIVAVNREKDRTLGEQRKTEQALEAETTARQRARQALDEMSSQVIEDWLARRTDVDPAQIPFLEKALTHYEAFAAESGDREDLRSAVANANLRSGSIRLRLGQLGDAERAFRRGRELYERLTSEFPGAREYRQKLADCDTALANVLKEENRSEEAETAYRTAIDLQKQLAGDFPTEPAYRQGLGRSLYGLAVLLRVTGRRQLAEPTILEAIAVQKQLVADFARERSYRQELARSYDNLAAVLAETRRPNDAEQAFRSALATKKHLVADFPSMPAYRHELAMAYQNIARLLPITRKEEAETALREAAAILRALAADFPSVPDYRGHLADSQKDLGRLFHGTGRTKEAEEAYRFAVAVRKQLAADFPDRPQYREALARDRRGLGIHLMDVGRPREAEVELVQAVAIVEELARLYPRTAAYKQLVAESKATLAVLWAGTGDHVRAVQMAAKLENTPEVSADSFYDLACACSLSVAAVRKNPKLAPAEQARLAEQYGSRAIRLCSLAVAKGYQGFAAVNSIMRDPDLAPIRSRPDFQRLLEDLKKKSPEKSRG